MTRVDWKMSQVHRIKNNKVIRTLLFLKIYTKLKIAINTLVRSSFSTNDLEKVNIFMEIFLMRFKYNVSATVCANSFILIWCTIKKILDQLLIAVLVLATKLPILRYFCTIPALFAHSCVTGYTRWTNRS
jgi:hypothetical protein